MHMADALVTPAVAGTMYACPAAVLVFIYEARTELLYGSDVTQAEAGKLSFKKILVVLALAAVVIGGGLSLMASEYPDGLEWSMEQVTGTAELEADGDAYETAAAVYQKFWRSGKHSGFIHVKQDSLVHNVLAKFVTMPGEKGRVHSKRFRAYGRCEAAPELCCNRI